MKLHYLKKNWSLEKDQKASSQQKQRRYKLRTMKEEQMLM